MKSVKIEAAAGLILTFLFVVPAIANEQDEANKALVQRVFDEFYNGRNVETLAEYMADDLVQHNPLEPDGRVGLVDYFQKQFWDKGINMKASIKRILVEDDLVFTQSQWTALDQVGNDWAQPSFAVGDIYRIENNKLAEHWDVGQPVPKESVNGNSMFDGGTWHPESSEVEDANKKVVLTYFEEGINKQNLDALDEIVAKDWIAHNPIEPNGLEGLKAVFKGFFEQTPEVHADVKRLIADGNFVVVHNHYTINKSDRGNDWAQPGGATFDIFRLEDGIIVEHWDIGTRDIPKTSVSGHSMFDGGALYNYRQ